MRKITNEKKQIKLIPNVAQFITKLQALLKLLYFVRIVLPKLKTMTNVKYFFITSIIFLQLDKFIKKKFLSKYRHFI